MRRRPSRRLPQAATGAAPATGRRPPRASGRHVGGLRRQQVERRVGHLPRRALAPQRYPHAAAVRGQLGGQPAERGVDQAGNHQVHAHARRALDGRGAREALERGLRGAVRRDRHVLERRERADQSDRPAVGERGQQVLAAEEVRAQVHGQHPVPVLHARALHAEAGADRPRSAPRRRAPRARRPPPPPCAARSARRMRRPRWPPPSRPRARAARRSPPPPRHPRRPPPRPHPRARTAAAIARPFPIGGSSRPCVCWPPPTIRTRRPSRRPRPAALPA